MAKMYFRYSSMGAGKTIHLLQVVDNYTKLNKKCLILKPSIDKKADNKVHSRIGISKEVDYLIKENDTLKTGEFLSLLNDTDCIVIDEAQFLNYEQIWTLYEITKQFNIPIIAYGLRTRVNAKPFEGSAALLSLADEITELKSICSCGKKATFQIRTINGQLDLGDVTVVIDIPENNVEYISICGECYVNKKIEYKDQLVKKKKLSN